ncbi:MAG: 4-hydroxy-3-methylbut-2-enyl diphosphate reductase [Eubacteriales bacterium]|nr:4-hydroxy-3-methylbut-2-enyl diphosphate reductase [Eubacteriales bacterium]
MSWKFERVFPEGGFVRVAGSAGFCFGVRRATQRVEQAIKEKKPGDRLYTLGKLIHNDSYLSRLADAGVEVICEEDIPRLSREAVNTDSYVFIRAHGITKETEELLKSASRENPRFHCIDCTCPYVKKIHRIAAENSGTDGKGEREFILIGSAEHPEVRGIMSYFEGRKNAYATAEELRVALEREKMDYNVNTVPVVAAQTTQKISEWKKSQEIIEKLYTRAIIFDTICNVTESRQLEAERLAAMCDLMIVIGGQDSSNTSKLCAVCRSVCNNTIRIADAGELGGIIPNTHLKVGIVAGASTPDDIIEEVFKTMSETKLDKVEIEGENFDEMLNSAFKTLNTGDTVTGTVIAISDLEMKLDLGAKVTGILTADQTTDDASVKLSEMYKVGDRIDAFVIRVSDVDGCAMLSKKRADLDKNWHKIAEAKENNETLEAVVTEAVKGGVVASVMGARVFIPASQTALPKEADLTQLVGKTVKFKVIEVKPQGKTVIGSIRAAAREERRALEDKFWSEIEVGKYYHGTVRGMTDYGVFVDLGGVDGMLHKKDLSWRPIHKPADILKLGDELDVFVKSYNPEKKQISLGYRTEETHPWRVFNSLYKLGDELDVTISSIMSYGAFARITDDVDGLIHVSQIALTRVDNPADVLQVGQTVRVKIIKIDDEQQRVSLSIRAILEEAGQAEDSADESAEVSEDTAADAE